ncbi:MAG: GspE/PulE/PilB domain-containing protein [Polyangiales bacterium]
MSIDLGRRLLASGTIHAGELRRALHEALVRERPLARALVEFSATARAILDKPLQEGAHPTIKSVVAHPDLLAALPPGLATRLLAVPLRKDPRTGTIDVAVVDPADPHVSAEVSFHLGGPVRAIAAPLIEIERALLLDVRTELKVTTAEYEQARPPSVTPPPAPAPTIAPTSAPDEFAVPLVRRARASMEGAPPSTVARPPRPASIPPPSVERPGSITPPPPSQARVSLAPPSTSPFENRERAAMPMVVDFSAAARAEKEEAAASTRRGVPPDPSGRTLEAKRPPFPSLTPILERIDVATDRDGLVEAILRGLATTATCAALFAPRRGRFVGVGAAGELDPEVVRGAMVPASGVMAEAVGKGERLGTLDPQADRDLFLALDLQKYGGTHVLLETSYLADRAALVLVGYGMGDVLEATRRARVLATAASAAMTRILKR